MDLKTRARPVHKTKAELILHELRTLIVDGQLLPGQRLVLREIAQDFGCSEIPVREALNALASLGLVKITPHEGARVSGINLAELIELTEVRLLLEREATLKASPHIPAEALAEIKRTLAQMEQLVAAKDAHAYGELNRVFHDAILDHCPNQKMASLIRNLREQTQRGRAVHRLLPDHAGRSLKLHKRLFRSIAARKLTELAAVLDEHNANILKSMETLAAADDGSQAEAKRAAAAGS